jgi:hypothetical protein
MNDDTTTAVNLDDPVDALDILAASDREIASLLDKWRQDTHTLEGGDDVDVRWERGSAAKLLLQHFAMRESAISALSAKLHADGNDDLAARIEGDGVKRRKAIDTLDEESRGRTGMNLNNPDVDRAIMALGEIFEAERADGDDAVVPEIAGILGDSGERDLPSARRVGSTAETHPSPEPGLVEGHTPLKAVRAFYQHLRGTPSGGTAPGVDGARDHLPGPANESSASPTNSDN